MSVDSFHSNTSQLQELRVLSVAGLDPRPQDRKGLVCSGLALVVCAYADWTTECKDATDAQYRTFRNNIPYLAALVVLHPLLRRLYNGVVYRANSGGQASRPTLEEADQRLNQRASFDFGFAIIYLLALHGVSAVKILAILYLNYQVATTLPRKSVPVATWVFNIGVLFANELGKGYKFKDIASILWVFLSGGLIDESNSSLVNWGRWLDSYGGLMGRWEILFNITVLRLISFNLDYYWSLDRRGYSPVEVW